MPFTWTINPYRGCEFACKYCYARYTHEFMEIRDNVEFERKIYVKQQAAWLLRQELPQVKPGEDIAIGTATDPYQPAEKRYEVTRAILQEIAGHRGLSVSIVTKSDLILRDLDVLQSIAQAHRLRISITVTTIDCQLARILEPRAPRPDLRLKAVQQLNGAGIRTGVICAPVIPGITDSISALEALTSAAAAVGARYVFANPLFLKPCSASVFMPFLENEFPHLVGQYQKRFGERSFVTSAYRKHISAIMSRLSNKYAIGRRMESEDKSLTGSGASIQSDHKALRPTGPVQMRLRAGSSKKPALENQLALF